MIARVLIVVALAGCVRSKTKECGDGTCPAGMMCASYREVSLCVTAEQVEACEGKPDLVECEAGFEGTCHGEVCLPIGCGNGKVDDPLYGTEEKCDDGERASHDGCSSTCQNEQPGLDERAFGAIQPVSDLAMVLDASRGRALMFGGAPYGGGAPPYGELFELESSRWTIGQASPVAPSGRAGHAMAYDAARRRAVLFGGRGALSYFDDTWEWDGVRWSYRDLSSAPPARAHHAMAFDPRRGVTVLYGGADADANNLGDTWEWNGATWTARDLDPSPAPRSRHALVYDPARGVIVMVGQTAPAAPVETWEYDGSWREVSTQAHPPSAYLSAAAYDGVDRRVLVTGGVGSLGETWTFDGAVWTQRATVGPEGRVASCAATQPTDGRILVFGGRTNDDDQTLVVGSTWRWDGASWSQIASSFTGRPVERRSHAVALDPTRGKIVMFGGLRTNPTDETWELDREGWTLAAPVPAPPARARHAMVFDAARRRVVMFGGFGSASLGDTWTWDGVGWTQAAISGPSPRFSTAMAYDAVRRQVVLFGGASPTTRSDTWIWDGTSWAPGPSAGPGARSGHAMAFDPIRGEVILFGGRDDSDLGDTWAWDGASWRRLTPPISPAPRSGHALAWDAARRRVVLIGGQRSDLSATDAATDVWEWDGERWTPLAISAQFPVDEPTVVVPALDGAGIVAVTRPLAGRPETIVRRLRWAAATAYEACRAGDHDRDGLIGCDDEDCWAQCTPTCPPGVTGCAAAEPRCGDGTCSSIESCHACPMDCGACPVVCGDFVCAAGEDCIGDCL